MNKIKSLFLAVALVMGLGSVYAFAVDDEPPCFAPGHIGYVAPNAPGVPPSPGQANYGTYNVNFRCLTNVSLDCHFVYDEETEQWYTCTGNRQLIGD